MITEPGWNEIPKSRWYLFICITCPTMALPFVYGKHSFWLVSAHTFLVVNNSEYHPWEKLRLWLNKYFHEQLCMWCCGSFISFQFIGIYLEQNKRWLSLSIPHVASCRPSSFFVCSFLIISSSFSSLPSISIRKHTLFPYPIVGTGQVFVLSRMSMLPSLV